MLFEVHLDQHILSDGLSAYRNSGLIFLPLGEFTNLLTIAITVNSEQKNATGFIISENRVFFLDLNNMTVRIGEITSPVDSRLIQLQNGEIFVERNLFLKWFPVELNIDVPSLTLKVNPKEPLPLQDRLAREKQKQSEFNIAQPDFQNFDIPYSFIDKPFIDQTLEGLVVNNKNDTKTFSGSYTTVATADLLGLESHILINGSDAKNLDNFRMTLGRDDPDGKLLGPLKARSFSFGNITLSSQSYTVRATGLGTGALVSNRPLTRPTHFDTHDFKGDLLPGWDVELFHNGNLIGHQISNEKNQYEFNSIPLLFGGNDFRLVFHGPAGQIREEHIRFMLEDTLVLPGEMYYSAGSVRLENGMTRAQVQIDQSLFPKVSTSFGFVSDNNFGRSDPNLISLSRSYYNLGIRSYLDPFFISPDFIISNTGGTLGGISLKTGSESSTLTFMHSILHDFSSEEFLPSTDPIISSTKLGFDSSIPMLNHFPFSIAAAQQKRFSGAESNAVTGKVSTYLAGFSFSNRVTSLRSEGNQTALGDLQISGRADRASLRGGFSYQVSPEFKATGVNLNSNLRLTEDINFSQNLSHQFQTNELRIELGANKLIGKYGVGFNVGGTNANEYYMGLVFNLSTGFDSRNSQVFTSAQSMGSTGAASIKTFIDKNLNGVMDDEDLPLEGVSFFVNGGLSANKTDSNGLTLITHLPSGQRVNVAIDRNSIDDPQQTPIRKGIRLLPRSGKIAQIDFPFILTTEIDGSISFNQNGKTYPAANLKLELVDILDPEIVISRTTTAFDGYYILAEVPPGQFFLQIEPAQAASLSLSKTNLMSLRILPNSNFINGLNFNITSPLKAKPKIDEKYFPSNSQTKAKAKMKLNYIILGSESNQANYEMTLDKLKAFNIPFKERTFTGPSPLFKLIANFNSAESLNLALQKLKKYRYSYMTLAESQKYEIQFGPYKSLGEVQKEKTLVKAGLVDATFRITEDTETKELKEVAVGGYENSKNAKVFSDLLKLVGFSEASIQLRSKAQWEK